MANKVQITTPAGNVVRISDSVTNSDDPTAFACL